MGHVALIGEISKPETMGDLRGDGRIILKCILKYRLYVFVDWILMVQWRSHD
jgi:hypothetical protein